MALYIKPPKGNINLNKLCTYVKKRFLFLQFLRGKSFVEITNGIGQEKHIDNSDCLIEGSVKDKISHFVLRYLCVSDYDMRTFLIQTETELFTYRLEFYNLSDIKHIMFNGFKQCKEILQCPGVVKSYRKILSTFVTLYQDLETAIQKNYISLKVPFTCALNFVRERVYPLQAGYLYLPISDVKKLLISLFENLLSEGINQMLSSSCLSQSMDPRLSYMKRELKAWFKSNICVSSIIVGHKKVITEDNLNLESLKFPICMKNIHRLLRKSHRLPHHARIQYILFLKDLGVPYTEVIQLFMKEYSIPQNKMNSCNHSWNDSSNRYIYSIEHLYGKRGSGKNYRAHSCYSLQSFSNSSIYDGGCPYSVFDSDHIEGFLTSENFDVGDIEDIKLLSNSKKYTESCCCYLSRKLQASKCISSKLSNKNTSNSQVSNTTTSNDTIKDNLINFNYSSASLSTILSRPSDFYFILSKFLD